MYWEGLPCLRKAISTLVNCSGQEGPHTKDAEGRFKLNSALFAHVPLLLADMVITRCGGTGDHDKCNYRNLRVVVLTKS